MRIIAGDYRGRTIKGPPDDTTTRPIIDRVKESLFNRLVSLGLLQPEGDSVGWAVVDVFCGTGSLGLESLSRGASSCLFVDMDRDAIRILRENIQTLGLDERAAVVQGSALAGYWSVSLRPKSIQVAFFDPPYAMMQEDASRQGVIDLVAKLGPIMEVGGVIVVRTPREIDLPELSLFDGPVTADYGGMRLHFYQSPISSA